jgi:hypothetical protein
MPALANNLIFQIDLLVPLSAAAITCPALWADTPGSRFVSRNIIGPIQSGSHQGRGSRIHQAVKNVGAFFLVFDQPSSTQHSKLLRNVRLRLVQQGRKVADAFGIAAQRVEDLQPHRMGQQFQQIRTLVI